MRATLATGVVAALAFLALMLFGPGEFNGPPQQVAAQAPEQPNQAPPKPKPEAVTVPLPDVLLNPVDVEFLDTPLRDVADFLGDQVKTKVFLDEKALKEEGVALDEPINLYCEKTPLYLILNRMLHPKDLEWYFENKMLFITTRIAAQEILVTKYYPVKPLLDAGYSQQVIVDLVQQMTEGPWVDIDGTGGELMFVGRMLAVRQSYPAHRETAQLLEALQKRNPFMLRLEPKEHARLREALDVLTKVEFIDTPLQDVAEFLSSFAEVPVVLEEAELKEEGIAIDEPINFDLEGQSLETTLGLILRPLDAEAILRDGTILITTQTVAEYDDLSTVIYNVKDIADSKIAMDQLEDAIRVATPGPWLYRDGTGGLVSTPQPGTMIIRQNEKNHREIVELLQHQRRQAEPHVKLQTPPEQPVTAMYRMNAQAADDLLQSLPEFVAPGTWNHQDAEGQGTIRKVAAGQTFVKYPTSKAADQTKPEAKKQAEKTADNKEPEPEYVVVPQAVLVIRQTPSVHREIEGFLQSLLPDENIYSQGVSRAAPRQGGGGGFF